MLTGLLDGVRARGAFVLRLSLDPPWSMRVEDRAPITVICQTHGGAVIVTGVSEATGEVTGASEATGEVTGAGAASGGVTGASEGIFRLDPGDVAVVRGTGHYRFADGPSTPPMVVILPGQRCTTPDGQDVRLQMQVGVRTWGTGANGSCRSVICAYDGHSEVGARLLDALPTVLVLRRGEWDGSLVDRLTVAAGRADAGQEAYLDRLLDLLLIDVLRTWFDRGQDAPGWWLAERDPIVGPALRLIYHRPAHAWTVASLAAAVGCSRAAFARRFTEQVGEPPIAFLTGWRLALAADQLRTTPDTIATIARRVGYGTPFALSTAFKRAYGVGPNDHRTGVGALN